MQAAHGHAACDAMAGEGAGGRARFVWAARKGPPATAGRTHETRDVTGSEDGDGREETGVVGV